MLKADANGRFNFPRSFNLVGPPCSTGEIIIRSPGGHFAGDARNKSELRLAVSIVAGPPTAVKIRSRSLGVADWSDVTGQVQRKDRFEVRDPTAFLYRPIHSRFRRRGRYFWRGAWMPYFLAPEQTKG